MDQLRRPLRFGAVSETPYRYEKIQRPDNIRLLELQPGERNSAIRLRLYEHDISISAAGKGTWEAISYVWGDPTDVVTITCNSRSLAITVTLSNALRRLRYVDRPRLLWADAICINQKDLEEKSAQIPLMANIYRNASQVLAYLGEDPDGFAFSTSLFIEKINGIFSEQAELEHDDVFVYYSLGTDDAYRKDQAGWAMLSYLTHLELFQRAWIIQELGLAHRTTLLWGRFRTTLHQLIHCLEHVAKTLPRICQKDKLRIDEITRPYSSYRSWLPENGSHAINAPARPDFLQVIHATRDYLASNERDYLYAFLGHPSARLEDGSLIVTPDYSLEASKIFADFTTAWI